MVFWAKQLFCICAPTADEFDMVVGSTPPRYRCHACGRETDGSDLVRRDSEVIEVYDE